MAMLKPVAMHSLNSCAHMTLCFVLAILFLRVCRRVQQLQQSHRVVH
jgi:hypothetical protein